MHSSLRNFGCPVTDEFCRDPRCKRARCILNVDAAVLEAEREKALAAREAELHPILERAARYALRLFDVRHPSEKKLNEAMAHPRIRAEAERKFADPHIKPWPNLRKKNPK